MPRNSASTQKTNDIVIANNTIQTQWNIFFNSLIRKYSNPISPSAQERKENISTIMEQIEKNDSRFVRYNIDQKSWTVLSDKKRWGDIFVVNTMLLLLQMHYPSLNKNY